MQRVVSDHLSRDYSRQLNLPKYRVSSVASRGLSGLTGRDDNSKSVGTGVRPGHP